MFTAALAGASGAGSWHTWPIWRSSVPSRTTARIQEGYMLYAHIMCELVERECSCPPTRRGSARAHRRSRWARSL